MPPSAQIEIDVEDSPCVLYNPRLYIPSQAMATLQQHTAPAQEPRVSSPPGDGWGKKKTLKKFTKKIIQTHLLSAQEGFPLPHPLHQEKYCFQPA